MSKATKELQYDNLDDNMRREIAKAIAEVDRAQIAITKKLTPAQRFQQMLSMIDFVEGVAAHQLQLRKPYLSRAEALRIIRLGAPTSDHHVPPHP